MDRQLFTLTLKKQLEQSLDRKQKWVEYVTIAYEAWMEQKETHFYFLSNDCSSRLLRDRVNKCLSMPRTLNLSALCIVLI